MVEAIPAGAEPLEFRLKAEREIRFNLDPGALFNIMDH